MTGIINAPNQLANQFGVPKAILQVEDSDRTCYAVMIVDKCIVEDRGLGARTSEKRCATCLSGGGA